MPAKKKVIRSKWPRVYWTPKDGRLVLCVDSRKSGFAAGGRQFWHSQAEALACAEQIARTKDNEGAAGFVELSPAERRDAAEALAHLDGAGSLLDAARLFMAERSRQATLAHIPNVSEAIKTFLKAKTLDQANGEITRLTLYDLESKMRIVEAELGKLKVADIDQAAVTAFLRKLPHSSGYKAAIRTKLSQLLNYCRREGKWITANPAADVQIRVKKGEVKILSVEQIRQLLRVLLIAENAEAIAPYLLVQLFGGLRPYEALRLGWERIHFDTRQIEVVGETSKTRETRFVHMEETLLEWLLPYRKTHGSIIGSLFKTTLAAIRRQAGFTVGKDKARPWPKDVLRHCYGSYWLAVHKDRAHLAELMGNSLPIIKSHYRRAIPDHVAQEFWKLSPAPRRPGKIVSISSAA